MLVENSNAKKNWIKKAEQELPWKDDDDFLREEMN